MGKTKIPKQRRLGIYQDISNYPWTAPCDGMISLYVAPTDGNVAYLHNRLSDGRLFFTNAFSGYGVTNETIVAKGTTMTNVGSANLSTNSYLGFIPFE